VVPLDSAIQSLADSCFGPLDKPNPQFAREPYMGSTDIQGGVSNSGDVLASL